MDGDPLFGAKFLRELYFKVDPDYSGRFTVPVLWDKKTNSIVNNESSEILRMFNTEFNHLLPKEQADIDLYPEHLRNEIDEQNEWVYDTVNNGVYKSGFATKPEAYESNVVPLFKSLDRLEKILDGGKQFVVGDQLTEADVRLYTTIVSCGGLALPSLRLSTFLPTDSERARRSGSTRCTTATSSATSVRSVTTTRT